MWVSSTATPASRISSPVARAGSPSWAVSRARTGRRRLPPASARCEVGGLMVSSALVTTSMRRSSMVWRAGMMRDSSSGALSGSDPITEGA